MKRIQTALWLVLGGLTLLWLLADPRLWTETDVFALRAALIGYTGVLAIGTMSVAMILALRFAHLEPVLGGLDKAYRLHKWLGIAALVFSALHFLLANVPKILVEQGVLQQPPAPRATEPSGAILDFFVAQRGLAEEFGDWGFKAAVILIAIALIKRFPYRFFFWSHRLLALVFVFLALHSLVLMDFSYWGHAVSWVTLVLMFAGTFAAGVSLLGLIGSGRRAVGEIEQLQYLENNDVLKVRIRLISRWEGHKEGQFAFVTFDKREGAHPFTIASAWEGDGAIAFFIKDLGDYTGTLPETLKPGDLATVEGPYGQFSFESEKARQIWIAGGIGIAPFVSRIKALMERPDDTPIDFFYSASEKDDKKFLDRVTHACSTAKVRLHVIRPENGGPLTADRIRAAVPEWREAGFLFCGPTAFGKALRSDLVASGLPPEDFHQELFEIR